MPKVQALRRGTFTLSIVKCPRAGGKLTVNVLGPGIFANFDVQMHGGIMRGWSGKELKEPSTAKKIDKNGQCYSLGFCSGQKPFSNTTKEDRLSNENF